MGTLNENALLKLWPLLLMYFVMDVDVYISISKFDNSDISNTFSLSPNSLIFSSV